MKNIFIEMTLGKIKSKLEVLSQLSQKYEDINSPEKLEIYKNVRNYLRVHKLPVVLRQVSLIITSFNSKCLIHIICII